MPIVVIARNGIGLGHISRSVALCNMLSDASRRSYLIVRAQDNLAITHRVPSVAAHGPDFSMRWEDFEAYISSLAVMSPPSIVVEDTIPLSLCLSPKVGRFLVLRPTDFESLQHLRQEFDLVYDRILVADHPDSPTWPYAEEETAVLTGLRNWSFWGPIYRSPEQNDIAEVRHRYHWSSRQRLCVFSLGGGGQHQGANDASEFIEKSTEIGKTILCMDPTARLIFVKGSLFPKALCVPSIFTIVGHERLMPALFAIADLAVIRPGFNSTWECLSGGTPFIPIMGTSFQEPIQKRIHKLLDLGIAVRDSQAVWRNDKRLREIWELTRELAIRWPGRVSTTEIVESFGTYRAPVKAPRKLPARLLVLAEVESDTKASMLRTALNRLTAAGFELLAFAYDARSRTMFELNHLEQYHSMSVPDIEQFEAMLRDVAIGFDPHAVICVDVRNRLLNTLNAPEWRFRSHIKCSYQAITGVDFSRMGHAVSIEKPSAEPSDARGESIFNKRLEGALPASAQQADFVEQLICRLNTLQYFDHTDETVVTELSGIAARSMFSVRIDDVCQITPELQQLLSILTRLRIPLSLEVVPYLCQFSDSDLDAFDPHSSLIEISQHGYCHLASFSDGHRKSEFSLGTYAPSAKELRNLSDGLADIEGRFPRRFRGGFSAPYDAVPSWFAQVWKHLGGKYLSSMRGRPEGGRLRNVQMSVDIWNWNTNDRRSLGGIWGEVFSSACRLRHVGVVLHQQHFLTMDDMRWAEEFFEISVRCGFQTSLPSSLARLDAERLLTSPYRLYNICQDASYE